MEIHLASSPAANGAVWLANCFLELNIMLNYTPFWKKKTNNGDESTFYKDAIENTWVLEPEYYSYQIFFPIFTRKKEFNFISDITFTMNHNYPSINDSFGKIVLFVRDPRDAIYSLFLRRNIEGMKYSDYCERLQHGSRDIPYNYLPQIDDWLLFHLMWLEKENIKIIHFEDYKKDAVGTLRSVLDYLDLKFTDFEISQAVENSTHEKSKEAEEKYYLQNPNVPHSTKMHRASKVNDYQNHSDATDMSERIISATGSLLNRMGYSYDVDVPAPTLEDVLSRVLLPRNEWFFSLPIDIQEKSGRLLDLKKRTGGNPVYLFGCGWIGEIIARDFAYVGFNGFIDSNPEVIGKVVNNLPVYDLSEVAKKHQNAIIVCATITNEYESEMQTQCYGYNMECVRLVDFLGSNYVADVK